METMERWGICMETGNQMNNRLFVAIIIFIIAVDWMACDMFLPAQPEMKAYFDTSASTLNFALSVYFIVSAISVLFGGPLSDRFGRKKLLLFSIGLFTIFGYGCAVSPTVEFLIACRGGAAIGAGIITAVSMAMVKDYLEATIFRKAMAVIQSVVVLGPVASPFIGSFVLMFAGWRWVMATLGILGTISFIFACFLPETLSKERRVSSGILPAMKGLVDVAKDKHFSLLLTIISLFCVPFFGFVAVCSYICINDFGLSYMQYSLFYAGLCVISFSAPFVYLLLDRKLSGKVQLHICFILLALTTVGLALFGKISPWMLFLVTIPYTYAEGIARPLGMVLLLNQHEDTTGAASALASFMTSVIGTVGTVVATLSWGNYIDGLFWIFFGCIVSALVLWVILLGTKVRLN
jgi:DHA1 family bicyclomycin/chloramphenicol resistance-like MFS transporter